MDKLFITTAIIEQLEKYCSEELIAKVLRLFKDKYTYVNNDSLDKHPTDYETLANEHYPNYWDITDFVQDGEGILKEKLHVIMSFITCDGVVKYKDELCLYRDNALLMHNLYRDKIIDGGMHSELLSPWVDEIKPFFT